ncbi:MAG: hypothetical protein V1777_03380 [Candidatus Micrarchaeota archaeon]
MASAFSLLVVAVIAVALLYVFADRFLDLFTVKTDPIPKLTSAVFSAKSFSGQASGLGEVEFSGQSGLSSSAFSDSKTDLVFECNDPKFCCDSGADCSSKIRWNSKALTFGASIKVPVFVRCNEKYDFFACTIFFGLKPGQLELSGFEYPSSFDLSANRPFSVALEVKNSGALVASPGIVTVKITKAQPTGVMLELPFKGREKELNSLGPSEFQRLSIGPIELDSPGNYEIVVRAESDNAGFDEKKLPLKVTGSQASDCRPITEVAPLKIWNSDTSECMSKFFCENCSLGIDCRDAWQAASSGSFELGDFSFSQTTEILTQDQCR